MLNLKDARGERFCVVIVMHIDGPLEHDRAVVVFLIDEMYRDTGDLHAGGEHSLMNMNPIHALSAE